jgi:hypothetical protein
VSRAAFLVNPNLAPGLNERFTKAEAAAKSLGIALRRVDAVNSADLTTALTAIQASSSQALLVQNDPMLGPERSRISDFAVAHQLPAVFEGPGGGSARLGLFTYGPDTFENARLAAGYIDKILKVPNRQICQSSSRRDFSSSSTSKPPRRSASPYRHRSSTSPTKS